MQSNTQDINEERKSDDGEEKDGDQSQSQSITDMTADQVMNKFKSGFQSFFAATKKRVDQMQSAEGREEITNDMSESWQNTKTSMAQGLETA